MFQKRQPSTMHYTSTTSSPSSSVTAGLYTSWGKPASNLRELITLMCVWWTNLWQYFSSGNYQCSERGAGIIKVWSRVKGDIRVTKTFYTCRSIDLATCLLEQGVGVCRGLGWDSNGSCGRYPHVKYWTAKEYLSGTVKSGLFHNDCVCVHCMRNSTFPFLKCNNIPPVLDYYILLLLFYSYTNDLNNGYAFI